MDVREKLVELLGNIYLPMMAGSDTIGEYNIPHKFKREIADYLISNGVTVQKHGYLETVVEVKDNTVCGNGARIEYKRCSCCKNPVKFFEDDFCGSCGAKLDLSQPPKGEKSSAS